MSARAAIASSRQKEIEFSRRAMLERWQFDYADAVAAFSHPEVLQRLYALEGVRSFDFTKRKPS